MRCQNPYAPIAHKQGSSWPLLTGRLLSILHWEKSNYPIDTPISVCLATRLHKWILMSPRCALSRESRLLSWPLRANWQIWHSLSIILDIQSFNWKTFKALNWETIKETWQTYRNFNRIDMHTIWTVLYKYLFVF